MKTVYGQIVAAPLPRFCHLWIGGSGVLLRVRKRYDAGQPVAVDLGLGTLHGLNQAHQSGNQRTADIGRRHRVIETPTPPSPTRDSRK